MGRQFIWRVLVIHSTTHVSVLAKRKAKMLKHIQKNNIISTHIYFIEIEIYLNLCLVYCLKTLRVQCVSLRSFDMATKLNTFLFVQLINFVQFRWQMCVMVESFITSFCPSMFVFTSFFLYFVWTKSPLRLDFLATQT